MVVAFARLQALISIKITNVKCVMLPIVKFANKTTPTSVLLVKKDTVKLMTDASMQQDVMLRGAGSA